MCNSASEKGTTTNVTNTTQTASATPQEQEMEKIQLQQMRDYAPGQSQMFQNAFGLGNQLLTSFGDKSGAQWQSLIGGVTPAQMQAQAQQAGRLTNASLNQAGMVDSGVGRVMNARAMSDSMNANSQFNVGALQNALNLALSGQAQVQQPAMGATSQLAGQLAGIRTISGTSSSYGTSSMIKTPGMLDSISKGMSIGGGFMKGLMSF